MARPGGKKKADGEDSPARRWFRAIRGAYGLDQFQLAEALGKSRSSIGGYETGINVPRETLFDVLTKFPDVPPPKDMEIPKDLLLAAAPMLESAALIEGEPYVEIPYAGEVPASNWGGPLEADTTIKVDGKFKGPNRFGCRVVGDSCWPALRQKDITVWESDRNPPHGVIVIAERDEDDGCTVKQLAYDAKEGREVLRPVNPRYDRPPDGLGWRATARLVGVIRKQDGPEKTWYWPDGLRPRHLIDNLEDE